MLKRPINNEIKWKQDRDTLLKCGFPDYSYIEDFHYSGILNKFGIPRTIEDCSEVMIQIDHTFTSLKHQIYCAKLDGETDLNKYKGAIWHNEEMLFIVKGYKRLLEQEEGLPTREVVEAIEALTFRLNTIEHLIKGQAKI
jgi:hypothetical protein